MRATRWVAAVLLLFLLAAVAPAAAGAGDRSTSDAAVESPLADNLAADASSAAPNSTEDNETSPGPNSSLKHGSSDSNVTETADTREPVVLSRAINRTQSDPDRVTVRIEVRLPGYMDSLTYYLASEFPSDSYTVVASQGFEYDDTSDGWTLQSSFGEGTNGTLTYTVAADSGGDMLDTTETDGWAFVDADHFNPHFGYYYYGDEPTFERRTEVVGEGYASGHFAFAGPVSSYHRVDGGQNLTVVVPDAATPEWTVERVFDTLAYASETFEVGDRDPSVTAYVLPDPIRGGGLAIGGAEFWVNENSIDSSLLHEYVHTRQRWIDTDASTDLTAEMNWLTEGSADYFHELISWRAGNSTDQAFRAAVATDRESDAILRDETSRSSATKNYYKGRRVLAALDIRMRQRSNGTATLADVFRALNGVETSPINYTDMRSEVVTRTDESTGQWLDTYTGTSDVPTIPAEISDAYDTNTVPSAVTGSNRSVGERSLVELDGTGSGDANGDALSYSWTQTAGPGVSLSDANASTPVFVAPGVNGTERLRFRLNVSDGNGGVGTDSVSVTVDDGLEPTGPSVSLVPSEAHVSTNETVHVGLALRNVTRDMTGGTVTFTVANVSVSRIESVQSVNGTEISNRTVAADGSTARVDLGPINATTDGEVVNVSVVENATGETAVVTNVSDIRFESVDAGPLQRSAGATVRAGNRTGVQVVDGSASTDGDGSFAGDGVHQDVNGDGAVQLADVTALFTNFNRDAVQNSDLFDFNGDGGVTLADVTTLFRAIT